MKGPIMISGGSVKLFAAIGVTYPEGSTCTCTNGTKTFTAKNTNGQWVFAIPEIGTWTVTATDGTESASESVVISAEGQSENVELSYALVLFDGSNGGDNTSVTGGWTGDGHCWESSGSEYGFLDVTSTEIKLRGAKGGSTYPRNWFAVASNKISVNAYSTVNVNFTAIPSGSTVARVILRSTDTIDDISDVDEAIVAYIEATSVGETSLSIGDIEGSYYVGVAITADFTGYMTASLTANKIWLE